MSLMHLPVSITVYVSVSEIRLFLEWMEHVGFVHEVEPFAQFKIPTDLASAF